jgi:hypothetical protein
MQAKSKFSQIQQRLTHWKARELTWIPLATWNIFKGLRGLLGVFSFAGPVRPYRLAKRQKRPEFRAFGDAAARPRLRHPTAAPAGVANSQMNSYAPRILLAFLSVLRCSDYRSEPIVNSLFLLVSKAAACLANSSIAAMFFPSVYLRNDKAGIPPQSSPTSETERHPTAALRASAARPATGGEQEEVAGPQSTG